MSHILYSYVPEIGSSCITVVECKRSLNTPTYKSLSSKKRFSHFSVGALK